MSVKRIGLSSRLNNQARVAGRKFSLNRVSLRRFPFPSAPAVSTINHIEDVFSTEMYVGTGATRTFTNNIDFSTKGGMVWLKSRDVIRDHGVWDTFRGATKYMSTNRTDPEVTSTSNGVISFSSTGFGVANGQGFNANSEAYVAWSFRRQAKFFDIVTFTTGTGGAASVPHSLESPPGMIIHKSSNTAFSWNVTHRNVTSGQYLILNSGAREENLPSGNVLANSTHVTYTTGFLQENKPYVIYLFAHNAGGFGANGTDNVISCGTYTGNYVAASGIAPQTIEVGFEPQWLLIKAIDSSTQKSWVLMDNMRGLGPGADAPNPDAYRMPNKPYLAPSSDQIEGVTFKVGVTATGFTINESSTIVNENGTRYLYVAIRRGPMRKPTSGTNVFYPIAVPQAVSPETTTVPFPPDLVNTFSRNGTVRNQQYDLFQFVDRLRSFGRISISNDGYGLASSNADSETASPFVFLKDDGKNITRDVSWNDPFYGNWIYYFWLRAPGFFDIVADTGTGSTKTVGHNLTVVPELMIRKKRNSASNSDWVVWHSLFSGTSKFLYLNLTDAEATNAGLWTTTSPTSSVFSIGTGATVNNTKDKFITYLFASCPGVSKVGSYTGTGTTLSVDCGFTTGARFVMIKRTDSTGEWYVWDTARGIVSGNDPYLLLNSTAIEVTNTDYIDPYSPGFELSSTAPVAINASGGTYIFLAVA